MRPEIRAFELQRELAHDFEPIVDSHGMPALLDALALLASEKADHIRTNWQDENLARRWEDVAGAILAAEFKAREKLP